MENKKIVIDVISDVACPWCYVGKKRLEAAIKAWKGAPVVVNWHPYQLDPTMTLEGTPRDAYLTEKFGNVEKALEMTDHLTSVGKELGIDFNIGKSWLAFNTLQLHQLLHEAGRGGYKAELKERFFKAYFETLEPLNDLKVLHRIMAEYHWSADKVNKVIANEALAKDVQEQMQQAQKAGVTGVPFFIVHNKFTISGAPPVQAFLEIFEKLAPVEAFAAGENCDLITAKC